MTTATTEPETITNLDTAWEIPCGGRKHAAGTDAHLVKQFASYLLHSPCCGFRVLLCEGRAMYLKNVALVLRCSGCGRDSTVDKWRFDLISGTEGTR